MIQSYSSISEKILKKSVWLYILSFVIAPLWYVSKILISWEISVSELGILYGVISLLTLISAVSDLGISESLKYHLPILLKDKKYPEIKWLLLISTFVYIWLWIILWVVFFSLSYFISNQLFENTFAYQVLQIFAFFFLWLNLFHGISHFFLAVQNTLLYKLSEFFRHGFILISICCILFLDLASLKNFSYAWILWVYSWLLFAFTAFIRCYYKQYFSGIKSVFDISLIKRYFWYWCVAFLSSQVALILSQVDMQMILLLLSTQDAWYYSVYLSLIMIPFLIISPIFLLLFPVFSELSAQNKIDRIIKIKRQLTQVFFIVSIYFSSFLYIFSSEIAYVFFWEQYLISWDILRYSIPFLACNLFFQVNYCLLGWLGKIKYKFYISFIALVINTILNYILIQQIWVSGAALATAIWWIFVWYMSEFVLSSHYKSSFSDYLQIGSIVLCIMVSCLSLYFQTYIWENIWRFQTSMILWWGATLWLSIFAIFHSSKIMSFYRILRNKSV